MFYLVTNTYSPNTAPSNRIIAYAKALSELNTKTRVIFFMPDKNYSKIDISLKNIDFEYCWDKHYIDIPKLKLLSFHLYMRQLAKRLHSNDKVLVYGFPDLVVYLSKKSFACLYSEKTEHPEASFVCPVKRITISEYLETCRRIAGVIVISQNLKDYFIHNGVSPEKIHVVNMIVDTSRFEKVKREPTEKYIAYCGTASNNKDGVDELIRAFAILTNNHPDYKLYIIGETPSKDQRFSNLELVKSLGIENKVVFTGIVNRNEIPQLLKNAEILALDRPDNLQAKYGFPTKLGEYLLTGNPVVVTRVGDIPLFLKDGESAFIAEPQNAQCFANKLSLAIEHPNKAKTVGENGEKVAKQSFNYLTETKKIVELLKK